jgi:hypothetical protein
MQAVSIMTMEKEVSLSGTADQAAPGRQVVEEKIVEIKITCAIVTVLHIVTDIQIIGVVNKQHQAGNGIME